MASGSPDLTTNQEPAEVREESSGKKKSKFKTFKKFFARKKRKEPSSGGAEAGLKASQSIDNVSKTSESDAPTRSEKNKGSGSKISLGGKAMSHDSVFVCDSSEANEALGASQDSIHGKVKSLQLQLKQAIRLGSPPSLMCVKKTEDGATTSAEDGLPRSPPEYAPFHSRQDQRNSSNSLHGVDKDQLPCAASSRAVSPLVVPGDFSQPASPFACLDNSAAKHKLGLRPKAHNRRKPVRLLVGKTEADTAAVEKLIISTPGAETNAEEEEEEEEERNSEDGIDDQLKPKVEEEEEEVKEKKSQAEDPRLSLLRGGEGQDESEAEADVSHGLDASCRGEQSVSEEETSNGPPVPSSESSWRASPLDPPRNTPEPPAGSRERVTPSTSSTEEDNQAESGSTSGGEAAFQEEKDGESSLLEEVLSSLKTPLKPCSLDGEDVEEALEPKEEMEKMQKEVEEKEEERIDIQTASPCSVLSDLTTEDQRDSCQEEEDSVEEEKAAKEEEEAGDEEEEESGKEEEEALNKEEEPVKEEELVVVAHFHEEETKKREEEEDTNMRISINEDDEEEEEFINLEKEDEDEKEMEEDEVQQQEGEEEDEAEMIREMTPPPQDEEDQRGSALEGADEVTKVADEEILLMQDEEDGFNQKSKHVEEEEADFVGEEPEKEKAGTAVLAEQEVETEEQEVEQETETAEPAEQEVETAEPAEQKVEQEAETAEQEVEQETETVEPAEQEVEQEAETAEQEVETAEPAEQEVEQEAETAEPAEQEVEQEAETAEPAEQEVEQEGDDVKQSEDTGLPEPFPPETQHESHSQESVISPSSKTSILNINLASPSSEKSFQFSPVAVSPGPCVTEFPTAEDEEEADTATKEVAKAGGSPPVPPSPEETKVRFTIAPAWQRSHSLTSPSSSPVCVSSPRDEKVPVKDHTSAAEPACESVLGPGRAKASGSPPSNSQTSPSPVKALSPAAANTTESAATTGGNADNPFGVRLRKTSTLLRFNSEEENPEAPVESVNPPTSCKAESPQVCSKLSTSQPVCYKPALPKKPELQAEAGGKPKRFSGISDPPRADPPSWISVAKQKQKLYKENSLDEITLKKEEQEKKPSLPNKEPRSKAAESSSHVDKPETVKPPVSPEKDPKRALSPQTSAAFKSQLLPCPVAPKPQVPPPVAKHPSPPQKSLPPPTPVPVHPKPPSTPPSKPTSTPQTAPVPSPSFVSRTTPEKSPSRSAGPPGPRGLPTPALPQDEPPWMALAKKKAKAWSEMPQIVQ